jgi:tetratricopeptide (TPR) repeat protein
VASDTLEESDVFALQELVSSSPENADAWVALAEYRWEQRRYADALSALNHAIQSSREPEQVLASYLTKGDLLLDAFPDAAAAHYRRAADLAPGLPGPHVRLGLWALQDDQIDVARTEAARSSVQSHDVPHRVVAAVLGELVASHSDFGAPLFTRRLVRRLDAAGLPRTEDLARYMKGLHAEEAADLDCGVRLVWEHLLRMVPLFWGGSGGDRNLVLPVVARAMALDEAVELPTLTLKY